VRSDELNILIDSMLSLRSSHRSLPPPPSPLKFLLFLRYSSVGCVVRLSRDVFKFGVHDLLCQFAAVSCVDIGMILLEQLAYLALKCPYFHLPMVSVVVSGVTSEVMSEGVRLSSSTLPAAFSCFDDNSLLTSSRAPRYLETSRRK